MMKKYKWTIIITMIITVSPMFAGLLLWNQLPDVIATHFGSGNVANGWSSKPFAVFGLPLIMAGVQFLCAFATMSDPKRKNINEKFLKWILWIIPVISLICCLSCYAIALGKRVDIGLMVNLLVGVIFIIMGNYMHKIKQNYTVGIKIPWTLHSEENWNRTHQLASWLWILGGICFIVNSFLQTGWVLVTVIVIIAMVPMVYSYILHRQGI